MEDIYKQLARILDGIPEGYPATDSGVELKILAKLFTTEEAMLACHLELEPLSAGDVARRIGWEERHTFTLLKGMTKKGLIETEKGEGGLRFKLMPFVVGFYEGQRARLDEEFAHLVETYYIEGFHKMMSVNPPIHRIIPIEEVIPVNLEVMPYERASAIIESAVSCGLMSCICRVQKNLVGQGCKSAIYNCLVFSSRVNAFENKDNFRTITKEQAKEILAEAQRQGLVHSTRNVRQGVTYICNCCTCCCAILQGLAKYGHMNAVGKSDFMAALDQDMCSGCGLCTERCPFHALAMAEGVCILDTTRCYGCGLCVSTCPTGALTLNLKPGAQIQPPPVSESQWRKERFDARKLSERD